MAAPTSVAKCRTHPAALAGWTCDACGSSLCPQCVSEEKYGTASVESCSRCGGTAVALRLHRSHRSYASRWVDSVRFMLRPSTLMSLLALGAFCTFMGWVGGLIGWVLSAGATWSYFFYVFLSAARGVELDVPDFSSLSDIIRPLIRGIISSSYVWLPAVLYAVFGRGGEQDAPSTPFFLDPLFLLILGWGLFYGPIAFMVAATDTSFFHLLNPVALVGWVFKLGSDYFIALGVVGVSLGIDIGVDVLGGQLIKTGVPIVSSLIPEVLTLIVPFFMSHVLGLLLYVHGDKVGYGHDPDYYEPVLPGARPQGRLPGKAREPSAPAVGRGVESRMAAVLESGGAVAASAAAPAVGDGLRAVADAVAARNAAGAVEAYKGLASSAFSGLAPEQHLFVGRAAASSGDFGLAAKAFETAADVAPDSPVAPQALVLLARLCAERMKDPARAQSVFRYIVHRYPNTDASKFAAQRIEPGV
jgi:hypothetical protein